MSSPPAEPLLERISDLCHRSEADLPSPEAKQVAAIRERLAGPLRVAVAGRVKAGKSTLLNAILGELLAPTDAGECTRIVTWYQHGIGYDVAAVLTDETITPLPYRRSEGDLDIDLDRRDPAGVQRIEVTVPVRRLKTMTLVDTPGLEALDEASAQRTREFLGLDEEGPSEVDAVVYLVRHFHQRDAEFLEAFQDRTVARPSPVNAVAVLSRADEIGAARPDALKSAAAIAERYARDEVVRGLCSSVIPLAGLLAETGRTLREEEYAALEAIAGLDRPELETMLLSVDRFCDERVSTLEADRRRALLRRFGLFGVRFAVDLIERRQIDRADQLAQAMVEASGLQALIDLLDGHFGRRSRVLKARSALANLRALVREPARSGDPAMRTLEAEIEKLEAESPELDELRLAHLLLSGVVALGDEQHEEVTRLLGGGPPEIRLGTGPDSREVLPTVILDRIGTWRTRAESAATTGATREAYALIVQSYEVLYAEATRSEDHAG